MFQSRFLAYRLGALLAVVALPLGAALAQQETAGATPPQSTTTRVTYDPTIPVGAVRSYIDACREGDYERAAERLDLSAIPEQQRASAGAGLARGWLASSRWFSIASCGSATRS